MFQSTHLHEVWPFCDKIKINPNQFQSTHLHEVWRHSADFGKTFNEVSIHTPTWGVTLRGTREYAYPRVSIHTPTWGVTYSKDQNSADIVFQSTHLHEVWHYQATKFLRHRCFNPHTYMRCDEDAKTVDLATFVSIHTPTWGVTGKAVYLLSINEFQSTHLHEVWLSRD